MIIIIGTVPGKRVYTSGLISEVVSINQLAKYIKKFQNYIIRFWKAVPDRGGGIKWIREILLQTIFFRKLRVGVFLAVECYGRGVNCSKYSATVFIRGQVIITSIYKVNGRFEAAVFSSSISPSRVITTVTSGIGVLFMEAKNDASPLVAEMSRLSFNGFVW